MYVAHTAARLENGMKLYQCIKTFNWGELDVFSPETDFQKIKKDEIVGEFESTEVCLVKSRQIAIQIETHVLPFFIYVGSIPDPNVAVLGSILITDEGYGPIWAASTLKFEGTAITAVDNGDNSTSIYVHTYPGDLTAAWGDIVGNINHQTDLLDMFNTKLDKDGGTIVDLTVLTSLDVYGTTTLGGGCAITAGDFSLPTGPVVDGILTTITAPGTDDKLATEQAIVEYVAQGAQGGAVTFNEPAADNSAGTQAIFDSATVGESVAFPNLLYLKSDGKWWLADADAAATMPGLRMALESKTADQTCSMLVAGRVRDDDWAWTVGGLIFASTTGGGLTQTAPSGSADIVQIVGVAYHADKMLFAPEADSSEVQ